VPDRNFTGIAAVCLAVMLGCWTAPCAAQPATNTPRRLTTDLFPAVSVFSPERWGIVGEVIANPSDDPVEVLSAHSFPADAQLQFARQLWIPAQAKRSCWYPLLPPADSVKGTNMPVQSLLIDRARGSEVLLGQQGDTLVFEGLLPSKSDNGPVTGIIIDPEDKETIRLVQLARVTFRRTPRLSRLDTDALPPTRESLDGLDQLVVASDRPAADRAGLLAIRQWLHTGGWLWIRLDRVSPDTVSLLLGEDCPCTVVDRVGLTSWQIVRQRVVSDPDSETFGQSLDQPTATEEGRTGAPEKIDLGANSPELWIVEGKIDDFEDPVEMVRVIAPGLRPVHSVNGWPASFWRRSGRGVVLFTTLGPRAWYRPRPANDRTPVSPENPVARFRETKSLVDLAGAFVRSRKEPPVKAEEFGPLLLEQVGYRIVGRGAVLAILGGFCLALGMVAWGLWRRGISLALLAWAGPFAGLAAALMLIVLGRQVREQIPPTAAAAQLVEITPDAEDAAVTGLLALYDLDGTSSPLPGSTRGGVFLPSFKEHEGSTRRMVWTDLDCWHWENLALPPGLHLAPFASTARIREPISARATFGPDGAIGTLALGPLRDAADAILAFPSHRNLAVRFTGEASDFTAGPGDQLARGQYLGADFLSPEQQRRQDVFKNLLERQTPPRYPARPTLLVWTSPLDLGFTFPEGTRQIGSALVTIPLEIDRPAPGTRLTIPAPFLSYRGVIRPDLNVTALYDSQHDTWVSSRPQPGRTLLRFQIPPELLPLRIDRAELEVDLNAQARPFEIFTPQGPKTEVVASRHSPVGKIRLVIERPDALRVDADGGLYLGLAIGEASRLPGEEKASSEWKINDLQLQLTGQIPEN
jgi:hypothetical protein